MKIKSNSTNKVDGLTLLSTLCDESINTVFFDPQYRGVLDKLNYGNEGSRQTERSQLAQMDNGTINKFIKSIDRVLVPSGHLFLWLDKYHLCQGVSSWIDGTSLNVVDMLVWDKQRIGMGYRTRRKCEYLLILQKSPVRAKGIWTVHNIPDVWSEKVARTHPHSKPVLLQQALIEATTPENGWVCDPAAGGYSVLAACQSSNRNFIGGDIAYGDDVE